MNFKDKTVVITGGNTGIGRELAIAFGMRKANVVVNFIVNEEAAVETISHIENLGGKAIKIFGDVTKLDDCKNIIDKSIKVFGKVDVLINNSGITRDNLIMRMSEDDFDKVIDVNLKGTWNMCKSVTRHMMKNRSGKIINISSVVGIMGNAGQSNYVASKAGIIGLTKSLAKEFGPRGITVNAVAPGFIETKMTEALPVEVRENYMKQIPLGKFGTPEDIANSCIFLASSRADYITGQVLSINGGMI
ncbi:3-oxoacyl-[acyl-carrier-protein] reductase FabG [Candidatus Izimaplasma bacterium HR1]|jgi:3-oxoacyl-[acyl-carrier protein] reductase|uniref:3-oxoacyl-[acyl-carrier-protein] reductase n=1 Tax=Candidatus Izimoplasma sp. HR1 TaxID=1541959 RepID=UPI0004F68151|nr:3-oxoacyl-[acyl-carrier-protein] reductase FabG [Candidatus Izimaplasma bacterium HR1]